MARFTSVAAGENLEPQLDKVYSEIMEHGFGKKSPVNWFTSQAKRPDILTTNWTLTKIVFLGGQVPAAVKQMIALKVSNTNSCQYCVTFHSRALETLGVEQEVVDCVRNDVGLSKVTPAERAILQFAIKASERQQSLTDEDYESLYEFGLTQPEVMEILFLVGFTNYLNFWADTAGISIDKGDTA